MTFPARFPSLIHSFSPASASPFAWGMMFLQQLLSLREKEFLNCCFPTALAGELLRNSLCVPPRGAERYLHNKHFPCEVPSPFSRSARLESL